MKNVSYPSWTCLPVRGVGLPGVPRLMGGRKGQTGARIRFETIKPVLRVSRFLSSPITIRVPFVLPLGFNKGTLKKKGKRVPLRNLGL